jgi:hypothetical protein
MAITNFGIQLKRGNGASPEVFTAVAEVISLDPPEIINEAIESTSHGTTAYRTFINSGLREVAEFTATVDYTPTDATHNATTGLLYDLTSSTAHNYQIVFPNVGSTTWQFSAIVTSFKPLAADAQKPETLQAEITFRPTGSPTLA